MWLIIFACRSSWSVFKLIAAWRIGRQLIISYKWCPSGIVSVCHKFSKCVTVIKLRCHFRDFDRFFYGQNCQFGQIAPQICHLRRSASQNRFGKKRWIARRHWYSMNSKADKDSNYQQKIQKIIYFKVYRNKNTNTTIFNKNNDATILQMKLISSTKDIPHNRFASIATFADIPILHLNKWLLFWRNVIYERTPGRPLFHFYLKWYWKIDRPFHAFFHHWCHLIKFKI